MRPEAGEADETEVSADHPDVQSDAEEPVPVDYWMRFVRGIGFHDATWRYAFGGNIYYANGSHGCVNLPYESARTMFNNTEIGTPVVCYWRE